MTRPLLTAVLVAICGVTWAPWITAQIDLDPPGAREFVVDRADLLTSEDVAAIRATCDPLLTEHATPIIVVAIERMADHGVRRMGIDLFARLLFGQWQIGHATLGQRQWNTGILIVVSTDDRRARIELGAGWGHEQDALCRDIMDERMVPLFKAGDFAAGIIAGVEALDAMARGKSLPSIPRPFWHYLVWAAFIGLAIFTVVSLSRRGADGWAWFFWAVAFSVLGTVIYHLLAKTGRGGGGGFGGGSFGGGSSGGGGASGSW